MTKHDAEWVLRDLTDRVTRLERGMNLKGNIQLSSQIRIGPATLLVTGPDSTGVVKVYLEKTGGDGAPVLVATLT